MSAHSVVNAAILRPCFLPQSRGASPNLRLQTFTVPLLQRPLKLPNIE